MSILKKKLSVACPAFFTFGLCLFSNVEAAVNCYQMDESLNVSRSDIASGDSGTQKSFAIPGTQSNLIINGQVDLNVESDIGGFVHGVVTKRTDFVWQVDITFEGNSNDDYITADYQFDGLSAGDNKICSSPNSCIDVVSISTLNSQRQRMAFWGFIYGVRTRESIELTLDLSDAKDSGTYTGSLRVELLRSADPSGGDGAPLNCRNR